MTSLNAMGSDSDPATDDPGEAEPSAPDLAAIDDEWPLIEAEIAVLDAQIAILNRAGGPSDLDWRRLRRARRRVAREALAWADRLAEPNTDAGRAA